VTGKIVQVSISPGGLPKHRIPGAVCTPLGLEGDGHRFPKFHGGPRKALLLVSAEDLADLKQKGYPTFWGGFGENLTVSGLDFRQLRPGQRFRAGEAVIELTQVRTPCQALDIHNGEERPRIQEVIFSPAVKSGDSSAGCWAVSGFYASVPQPGYIGEGDAISLLEQVV
jgi:MOSC domain-containing protein YiiM